MASPQTRDITLTALHPGQMEIFQALQTGLNTVVCCGRQFGKTKLLSIYLVTRGASGQRWWWVAPTYKGANEGWAAMIEEGKKIPGHKIMHSEQTVSFPGGGSIAIRSGDKPDDLRGPALNGLVLEEAAFFGSGYIWTVLNPTLLVKQGQAVFISTPNGMNHFYDWYQWGNPASPARLPGWQSLHRPTAANPMINPVYLEALRHTETADRFRQEYLAEFVEDGAGVFRGVDDAATAVPQTRRNEQHSYVIGVDWGKVNDFSVFAVGDANTGELVRLVRSNQIDYMTQVHRLHQLAIEFNNPPILAETNGMEGVIEMVRAKDMKVIAWTATNASKQTVINDLQVAFEQQRIRILPDSVLLDELKRYTAERLPSGLIRYSAPEGHHDDTVMALALMWQAMTDSRRVPIQAYAVRYL